MFNTRAEQTTNTTGTGTIDLIAPLTGRLSFVTCFGNGNKCYYILQTADESQWEEGIGTVISGSPDQLTRDQVIRSSNSNNLVNFPAGTKTVYVGQHSDTVRFGGVGQLPTEAGSAGTRTLSFAPAVRHIRAGMVFSFISQYAGSGGAQTLNINGTGAYALKTADGLYDPDAYDIQAGGVLTTVMFDGTKYVLVRTGRAVSRAYVDATFSGLAGMIGFFPTNTAPAGWLKANGALVSRTTYANLWAYANGGAAWLVSDATWSGSGIWSAFSTGDLSTTFRLPEIRGEFIRAYDDSRGIDSGRGTGTKQDEAFKQHNHTASTTDPTHKHISGDGPVNSNLRYGVVGSLAGGNQNQQSGTTTVGGYTSSEATGISVTINNSGGTETRPRNVTFLACIKY